MTIQQAIKKAIKGWYSEYYGNIHNDFVYDSVFLDHLFWQSLGKAIGWDGYTDEKYIECPMCFGEDNLHRNPAYCEKRNMPDGYNYAYCGPHQLGLTEWKKHWHRFIDHLAEGKTAESFFEQF